MQKNDILAVEFKINYKFKDKNILNTAFTHSSYAYKNNVDSNERYEFLGDSILNFCTTTFLFDNFKFNEGDSSKIRAFLVSSENVSKFIFDNNLEKYLLCDNFSPNNSTNVMGDLYEAVVGAMYIDSDIETCKKFIYQSLGYSKQMIESVISKTHDYKTELQEYVQQFENKKLCYNLIAKTGPAHRPEFTIQVEIDGRLFGKATSFSKKEAENLSAKKTLLMVKNGIKN